MAFASNPPKPSFSRRALERLISSAIISLPLLSLTTWPWVAAAGGLLALALIFADGYSQWTWSYRVRRAFGGAARRSTSAATTLEALFALQSATDDEDEERRTKPSEVPAVQPEAGENDPAPLPPGATDAERPTKS